MGGFPLLTPISAVLHLTFTDNKKRRIGSAQVYLNVIDRPDDLTMSLWFNYIEFHSHSRKLSMVVIQSRHETMLLTVFYWSKQVARLPGCGRNRYIFPHPRMWPSGMNLSPVKQQQNMNSCYRTTKWPATVYEVCIWTKPNTVWSKITSVWTGKLVAYPTGEFGEERLPKGFEVIRPQFTKCLTVPVQQGSKPDLWATSLRAELSLTEGRIPPHVCHLTSSPGIFRDTVHEEEVW